MTEASDLLGLAAQCAALIGLGLLVSLLARRLRFRDGAPAEGDPRANAMWALLALGIGWLLVTGFLFTVGGNDTDAAVALDRPSTAGPGDVVGQLFAVFVAFGPILIVMQRRREPPSTAGVAFEDLPASLFVGAVLIAAFVAWTVLVTRQGDAGALFRSAGIWALLQFTLVGFAEEFAYRGYLQTRLIAWLGPRSGWVIASVVMAMAHVGHRIAALGMSGAEAMLSATALIPISLFLGYVMLKTRSIIAPGLLHTAINWLEL